MNVIGGVTLHPDLKLFVEEACEKRGVKLTTKYNVMGGLVAILDGPVDAVCAAWATIREESRLCQ